MRRVASLPAAFGRFAEMGGVLNFAVFEEAQGTEEETLSVIPAVLAPGRSFDARRLAELGRRRIGEAAFFGDWYDFASGMLLRDGDVVLNDGTQLHRPRLADLAGREIRSASAALPQTGAGGNFAYAFSWTPYGLSGGPLEIQAIFEQIRDFILPHDEDSQIFDWSDARLTEVSDYFDDGAEWWGVFLFSIYAPALRRLILIAGSTTD